MKKPEFRIAIIGAGRVGTTFGYLLNKQGYAIENVISRSLRHAKNAAKFIGAGIPSTEIRSLGSDCNLIFITTPDGSIGQVAADLAAIGHAWRRSIVFHCSGYLDSTVLDPLQKRGAKTASMHPLQTFSQPKTAILQMKGSFFTLEGNRQAVQVGKKLVRQFGGRSVTINARSKRLYHCAATLVCGHLAALNGVAIAMMEHAGIREEKAKQMLAPLVRATVENIQQMPVGKAVTGAVARGDFEIVKNHIQEAKKLGKLAPMIYRALALQTLSMIPTRQWPARTKTLLRRLLEEK